MNKLSMVLAGAAHLLAACASDPETVTPLVAADPITTTTPAAPAPKTDSAPLPVPAAPAAPAAEPAVKALDVADPIAVAAYCAEQDSKQLHRGSMTNAAPGDDITARFVVMADASGAQRAQLVLHVAHAPTKSVHPEHGRERSDSWSDVALTVDWAADTNLFTVGTYEGAGNEGSTGGNTCWAAAGVGGGTSFHSSPVKLVITKRTDALIEGTYDDTAFSAAITRGEESRAEVCCL